MPQCQPEPHEEAEYQIQLQQWSPIPSILVHPRSSVVNPRSSNSPQKLVDHCCNQPSKSPKTSKMLDSKKKKNLIHYSSPIPSVKNTAHERGSVLGSCLPPADNSKLSINLSGLDINITISKIVQVSKIHIEIDIPKEVEHVIEFHHNPCTGVGYVESNECMEHSSFAPDPNTSPYISDVPIKKLDSAVKELESHELAAATSDNLNLDEMVSNEFVLPGYDVYSTALSATTSTNQISSAIPAYGRSAEKLNEFENMKVVPLPYNAIEYALFPEIIPVVAYETSCKDQKTIKSTECVQFTDQQYNSCEIHLMDVSSSGVARIDSPESVVNVPNTTSVDLNAYVTEIAKTAMASYSLGLDHAETTSKHSNTEIVVQDKSETNYDLQFFPTVSATNKLIRIRRKRRLLNYSKWRTSVPAKMVQKLAAGVVENKQEYYEETELDLTIEDVHAIDPCSDGSSFYEDTAEFVYESTTLKSIWNKLKLEHTNEQDMRQLQAELEARIVTKKNHQIWHEGGE